MSANRDIDVVEREVQKTQVAQAPWYQRISWRAIFAGVVIALLTQFLLEMLGVALGVGALEPGEDTLGPEFSSAVVIWLTGSALLSLFAGGLATGRLSESTDGLSNALMAIVMMGVATFISFFLLSFALSSTVRGVSNAVGEGLSFVGSTAEDVSTAVADAVELRDGTLDEIRTEADEILADDASLTSLRIALDDYLLADEPGEDTRQAAIEAITTQTTLNEAEASQQLDEWEADLTQAVKNPAASYGALIP